MIHKISSRLTLIETFNLGCDTDLEHSNPIFSLDASLLTVIYHQIEFGCKTLNGLELIKDIVETIIFWLYKPTLWPWPWRQNLSFLHDILAHGGAPQYHVWLQKVANKHSANWEQIFVTSVTSLTPEDTTVLSVLQSINTSHTAQKEVKHCCYKSADVDSYIRVGWKSMVLLLAEIVLLCAHMLF